MRVLVTGAAGMIGSHLVDGLLKAGYEVVGIDRRAGANEKAENIITDLGNGDDIKRIVAENNIDRIIHLAALAHTEGEPDLSYEKYYHVNVRCAENVFKAAGSRPVLFISTVDVYGFTKGTVDAKTELHPVTAYGKTKALAEEACKNICENYSIFRFSPVYTRSVKRDIQKRYYLKYPNLAYIVGKGTEYEVLDVDEAVRNMVVWCGGKPQNEIKVIKDAERMKTVDYIASEKKEGRAKRVLHIPRWCAVFGFGVLKVLTGKNKYTYLLNKAVNPLRTE